MSEHMKSEGGGRERKRQIGKAERESEEKIIILLITSGT